jgi:putative PIG3 family NAD(P)H quinone oxidoreductase
VKYLHVVERDGRYVADLADTATPDPRAGEVLVRVAASGLNRADLSQIAGRYPPPPGESEILGLEISGTTADAGEPVCALLAGGGHAEYAAVPEGQLFPAPPPLDLVTAAGVPEAFLTAFATLVVEGGLAAGGSVLVHAGASGVGFAAIQLAKWLGARVAATTRTREKLSAIVAAGADLAIHGGAEAVTAELARHWGPDAVDVVLDPVGATTLAADLSVLAPKGRIIVIATLGGARVELDLGLLMKKRGRLIGSMLRARSRTEKAALVGRFRTEILPGFATGALRVVVDSVFTPTRAAEAFQRMRDNASTGKLLIDWRGGAAS